MIVVGITGAIGAGKSSAIKYIASLGYKIIEMDSLSKILLNEDESLRSKIKREFGDSVYSSSGELIAENLASIVFGNSKDSKEKLKKLNSLTHPAAIDEMMKRLDEFESDGEIIAFVESALIFELGLEEGFDYVVSVSAKEEIRKERALKKGLSLDDFEGRASSQFTDAEKSGLADFVIENNGDLTSLNSSLDFIIEIIKSSGERDKIEIK